MDKKESSGKSLPPDNKQQKKYPKSRLGWLWENMEGRHALFIVALFGTALYNVLQLVVPHFSRKLIGLFEDAQKNNLPLSDKQDTIYTLIALMVGLTLFRVIIVYLDCMAYERVSQGTLFRIRNFLYNKIQRQDMKFYSTYRTGDLMTRVTGDLDAVRHNIAWVIRCIVESVTLFLSATVYFFTIDVVLALCIVSVAPLIFFIVFRFRRKVAPMHKALREKLAGMNTDAQENISGNRVVKAFAREEYEKEKFNLSNEDYRDTNIKTQMVWLRFFPFVELIANALPVILLLVGGVFIINGRIDFGDYTAFSLLIWAIANPMRMMGNIMNEFQRFSAASDKIMEIYYSEAEIVDHPDAIPHPERFEGKIEFEHVSFQYTDGKLPVLKDISFTAEPGETVAIIGETGCGKTSLIQMIPRFYEPNSGSVRIDGVPVENYKLTDLRKNIGLATQDVLLYSDTIEGNIAYGAMALTAEEVEKYARYSAASDFIHHMPEGYDTIVGERGVGLSGGQKQRISLARALAIRPSILILDDTTSAVDMAETSTSRAQRSSSHSEFRPPNSATRFSS